MIWNSIGQGITFALSQVVSFLFNAAVLALGAYLMDQKEVTILNVFRVLSVVNLCSEALGRLIASSGDTGRAMNAAEKIFCTLDRRGRIPRDEGWSPTGAPTGDIEFRKLTFQYPTRPGINVLNGFSYTVHSGRTVALVGESGCGKTTLLYLVQRLYDTANPSNELTPGDQTINQPESGVFLDGINIKYFSPRWLRQQIGIVAQEPELFDISLADNIAYGDNSRKVSMEEIIEASMQANIHDFVMSLPKGYQTMAGSGGSHLSGGQKQRIAIARALVRHPSILLLDEATSALDAESERLVQSALDSAACDTKGVHRTCLVVAHRLSTVQTADTVVVIQRGQKMESGSPKTLLEAKGAYYALYHASKISEP